MLDRPRLRAARGLLALVAFLLVAAPPTDAAAQPAPEEPPPAEERRPEPPGRRVQGEAEDEEEADSKEPTGPDKGPLSGLEYRPIGPAAGGRVSRVAGVPGDPLVFYAATASGGVWKSTNGGRSWSPIFDDQPVSSIGSVAVAPSDPNVVWVGSGEANIRGNVGEGNGIYRSTDAGKTWSHVWRAEGQIGSLAVHPQDPDVAYAAAQGSPFGPGAERGVYRTRDGGRTWKRVLFVDEDTGASDVCLDPANPRRVFAGTWQARRSPWGLTSGGKGSGLWLSHDGGETWDRLRGAGLPKGIWGKVAVRVAPSDPQRVYALIEAEEGGLFRSDDGGESWSLVNASRGLRQRAWYFTHLTIDPRRPEVVWFPQVSMLKTVDGGEEIRAVSGGGWDYHDLWIDPVEPRRMVAASDAGVSLSVDGGESWDRPALPISQLYRVSADRRVPYRVMGALQDWGTLSGPSNSLHGGGILPGDWHPVGGGEAGHVVADPFDPGVVWAGEYLGIITRWDERTGQAPPVGIYLDNGSGHGAEDLRWRFQWTAPIVASRHQRGVVYHAANVVFRSSDGGRSWEAISPDLTRDDPQTQKWSGGPITGDNTGVEHYPTIFALAESPVDPQLLWAGSDDGLVHVSRDAGGTWKEVTPRGIPKQGTISIIEPSPFDAGTAWVVVDAHRLDDERPYLLVTEDFGATWRSLARGLDSEVYLHSVRADPQRRGLLYLATERGVMVSWDAGASWQPLRLNLPTVAVVDLAVAGDDLVVGTLGRSIWILDDLTPVRQWRPEIARGTAHLFPPRPAVRWRLASSPLETDEGAASNPPNGAVVTYFLRDEAEEKVTLEVLDAAGTVVRTLTSEVEPLYIGPDHPDWPAEFEPEAALSAEPGLHRAVWDFNWAMPPFIPEAMIDTGDPHTGPLAVPGDYQVRLTVGGESFTQPLRVDPDPRIEVPPADRAALLAFQQEVLARIGEIADLVGDLRAVREQLGERLPLLGEGEERRELREAAAALTERLDAAEGKLHNPEAEVTYDILAGRDGGTQLHSRYFWLFEMTRSHDGPPTQGMRETLAALDAELAAQRDAVRTGLDAELARINALAEDVSLVVVPP